MLREIKSCSDYRKQNDENAEKYCHTLISRIPHFIVSHFVQSLKNEKKKKVLQISHSNSKYKYWYNKKKIVLF